MLPETGFCAVSVAGGDLAQLNVAFPGTGARTFCVMCCTLGVIVGVVSCVLDRPAVVCGREGWSWLLLPFGWYRASGCIAGFLLVASCLPPVLPCSGLRRCYGPGRNPLKLNSSLGFP